MRDVSPDPAARKRFSFSRLSNQLIARPTADEFAATEEISGRRGATRTTTDGEQAERDPFELGTLVHAVLARLTPERCRGLKSKQLDLWIEHAAETLEIDDDDLIAECREMLEFFLRSRLFGTFKTARELRTEVEFVLPWHVSTESAERKKGKANPTDSVCHLQGYLDALVCDADERWWIVDYKTNRVPENADDYRRLIAEYAPQLGVYALAVEQSLNVAPAGMILHLLRTGEDEKLEWNAARCADAGAWLDAALISARNT
ncbi:MAG: PD-(D/E)XK nuclease family protein [Pirellulales bacterium]